MARTKPRGELRLTVDRNRCDGFGMCEQVAPALLELDGDGELVILVDHVPPEQAEDAEAAVHACPVAALGLSK